jgi:transcriptional regulator with XRE-family HTH domain
LPILVSGCRRDVAEIHDRDGAAKDHATAKAHADRTAKLAGISQADLSRILRGRFRGYSEAKLTRILTAFGQDVQITSKPHRKAGDVGRIIFRPQSRKPRAAVRTARGVADTVIAAKTKRKSNPTGNLTEFFAGACPLRRSGMR